MNKAWMLFGFLLAGCGGSEGLVGPTGPAGAKGATGAQGSPGADLGKIASGIYCSKTDSGSGLTFTLTYQSVITQGGDRYVTCFLAGSVSQISEIFFYTSNQVGSVTGLCVLNADIDAASSGYWVFTSQSGVTKAAYSDSGSAHNGYTYTFASGDCTTY